MYSDIIRYEYFHDIPSYPIVNLIIYNESSPHERRMKDSLSRYLSTVSYVTPFFITLRDQDQEYVKEHDVLYIKGNESFCPGILIKTIKAMNYVMTTGISFTYLVRSNISTAINFSLFPYKEISRYPFS